DPRIPLPTILGHEGVGEVEEVGPNPPKSISGRELKPGDWIAWDRGVTCGHCLYCAVRHEPNLCPSRWAYGIGRSSAEPPYLVGCYADHIVLVRGTNIIHLDEFPRADCALLASASCSGATAANAVEVAGIQPGDAVLVQGSGPLGLFLAAFAIMLGASPVIVVGGSAESLALALKLGADLVLSHRTTSSEERVKAIYEIAPLGIDTVLESSGRPDSINEGILALRRGGSYISTGFAVPGTSVTLDCYQDIVRKNLRLQGVWTSHTRHLCQSLTLVSKNPLLGEMITSTFTLDRATEALIAMERREVIKSAIVF
ncbi:MAG: zinc-binding dehydrogenase, partial [Armatimonadota bacterium]|nr:zinc-binding dehydrogenase [Armatimonadota bacterium]